MTKERPILFGSQMVQAILEGRKTQTRRIVTGNSLKCCDYWKDNAQYRNSRCGEQCPYGIIGDRLWIKTGYSTRYDERLDTTYWSINSGFVQTHGKPLSKNGKQKRDGRHPGMFMPFWLSQQLELPTLEITGVRVERLNYISEADAMAEGCERLELGPHEIGGMPVHPMTSSYVEAFQELWQSINGPESWALNPWVWVIEFKKEEN